MDKYRKKKMRTFNTCEGCCGVIYKDIVYDFNIHEIIEGKYKLWKHVNGTNWCDDKIPKWFNSKRKIKRIML